MSTGQNITVKKNRYCKGFPYITDEKIERFPEIILIDSETADNIGCYQLKIVYQGKPYLLRDFQPTGSYFICEETGQRFEVCEFLHLLWEEIHN